MRRCCETGRTATAGRADGEGLHVRPGGALVPRLRRLRDPRGGAEIHARLGLPRERSSSSPGSAARRASRPTWRPTGCTRSTAALLRSRPGSRSRGRISRFGRDRRRRRALDRRQPPDPRVAAQREHQDPALQHRDLRADEGPVLPDLAARDAGRTTPMGRSTGPSSRCRWRSAPKPRSSLARSTRSAST